MSLDRCPAASDQRGSARPFGYVCDIGSVERDLASGDDTDGDGLTDSFDPCTNPGGSQDMRHPRLILKNINADTLVSNDRLRLHASFSLPAGLTFSAINPLASGARLIIENSERQPLVAVVVPARARIHGSAGWASSQGGSLWRFTDNSRSVANGIRDMKIVNRHGRTVGVRIRGRKGVYPVVAGDRPLRVTVVLGGRDAATLGQCGETSFGPGACRFDPTATTLRCR